MAIDPPSPGAASEVAPSGELQVAGHGAHDLTLDHATIQPEPQGFGQLWKKVYEVTLGDCDPVPVMHAWRERLSDFWPDGNDLAAFRGLEPGELALIEIKAGGLKLSTGVIVIGSTATSLTFATPEGHPFAGTVELSTRRTSAGTVARVEVIMRASDPLYEMGLMLGGQRREDAFWLETLTNLSRELGAGRRPRKRTRRLDRRRRWSHARNVTRNAAVRSVVYNAKMRVTSTLHWTARRLRIRSDAPDA
ncbi:hypothetical protein AYO38_00285 [bacterium SCGC AG-212-C10]|nr:hypothetical protein AYO38_00285 [bacterium SCGC AG-212-C10]